MHMVYYVLLDHGASLVKLLIVASVCELSIY
jgi:hypothetical protein